MGRRGREGFSNKIGFIRFERTFSFGLEILWEFFASLRVRELHQEQVTTRDWISFSLFAPEGQRNLAQGGAQAEPWELEYP